ncbi:helix-turn-helix domain-containing protein [Streptomyces sp. NPDC057702]|uniref:helix-turn-helix domain-containing protein n=1 Tax=unclassified Streptomyces TaxID=2593676 RepID=UPI0036BFE2C5
MLSALGLDEVQESAYRILVGFGATEVSELALQLARSEEDVERALRRLERQGLTARSSGRAGRWVAVPPSAALGTLLSRRRHELERAERAVAALADAYRDESPRPPARDVVEVACGTAAIGHRWLQLVATASDEVCALVPAAERVPSGLPCRPEIRHRVVVERALLTRPTTLGALSTTLGRDYEAKIRVVDRLPTTLLVVDGHLALTALHRPCCDARAAWPGLPRDAYAASYDGERDDGMGGDGPCDHGARGHGPGGPAVRGYGTAGQGAAVYGTNGHAASAPPAPGLRGRRPDTARQPAAEREALVVHPSGLLAALRALFEGVWREATPLRPDAAGMSARPVAPAPVAPDGPDATDLEILALLLAGLTDASVAKQLDLGLRTVQRRVKGLMERAGVTTRLQLGWHARERHWISLPAGAAPRAAAPHATAPTRPAVPTATPPRPPAPRTPLPAPYGATHAPTGWPV